MKRGKTGDKMSESSSNPSKSPSTIGLNPDAREFVGEAARRELQRKNNQQRKTKKDKKHFFNMNPEAKPWLPASHTTGAISNKPVVLLLGVPGSGVSTLGKELAQKYRARFYSGHSSRREAETLRKKNFDNTPASVWRETLDTLSGLDEFLSSTSSDKSVEGYFLDVQCRNSKIIFYLSHVLKKHKLAPGHIIKLITSSSDSVVKSFMEEEGEQDFKTARRQVAYLENEGGNLSIYKDVMKCVTEISCQLPVEEQVKEVESALGDFNQKTVAFAVPPPNPYEGVKVITDPVEYCSVLSSFSHKVSAGTTKWPGYREGGQIHRNDLGEITNAKASKPSGDSHKISLRSDGAKHVLLYTAVPHSPKEGRFYLIPKACDTICTLSPKIGDLEYGMGKAPVYGETGDLLTIAVDGEMSVTKSGWDGRKHQQSLFIASDMLYYGGEKRDRMSKYDYWTLERRLGLLRGTRWPTEDAAPIDSTTTVSLCLKSYYALHSMPTLVKSVQSQNSKCTVVGITFTPTGKYIPHGDPNLFTWYAPKHKKIHLAIKKEDSEFILQANKEWGSDVKVEVGRTAHIPGVPDGNTICRLQWTTSPGGEYSWDILGSASDCWEVAGVENYKLSKFWINPDEILEKLNFPVPPESRKLKVERVSDDDVEVKAQPSGRGRGGHRGGR